MALPSNLKAQQSKASCKTNKKQIQSNTHGCTKTGYLKTKFEWPATTSQAVCKHGTWEHTRITMPNIIKKKCTVALTAIGGTGVARIWLVSKIYLCNLHLAATVTSTANSGAIFVGLNIPQDTALHTVAVAACTGLGAIWYYAVNRSLNPLALATMKRGDQFLLANPKIIKWFKLEKE